MRVGYLRVFSVYYLHRNLHSGVLHMWVEKVVEVVVVHCCYSFQARPLQARPVLVLGLDSDCDYADYKFCVIVYGVAFRFESDNDAFGVIESDVGGVPVDDSVSTP